MSSAGFVALIPARRASSRLPDKALLDIAGIPMVVRVARQAQQSQARQVVVATDDSDIASVCRQHGVDCVMTDVNHPSGSDRLAQACTLLNLANDDIVVNVQGDEPLISPDLINRVALTLLQRPDCAMSTAAHPIHDPAEFLNPNVVKTVLDARGTALYFSRAPIAWWRDGFAQGVQQLPKPAPLRHLGLYAYRCQFLKQFPSLPVAPCETLEALEQLRVLWHGHRIAVHVTHDSPSPGVDTPQDLERVRQILAQRPS
ncbi:MAG: 3-deoxy-manno-octulosonate cytidylyltransferase [Alphaproteobacteria bacterium]|nr:3-deoxy-manno-octulosonate cytidylyltransferase [Alphaproteobacteria bacterium]